MSLPITSFSFAKFYYFIIYGLEEFLSASPLIIGNAMYLFRIVTILVAAEKYHDISISLKCTRQWFLLCSQLPFEVYFFEPPDSVISNNHWLKCWFLRERGCKSILFLGNRLWQVGEKRELIIAKCLQCAILWTEGPFCHTNSSSLQCWEVDTLNHLLLECEKELLSCMWWG